MKTVLHVLLYGLALASPALAQTHPCDASVPGNPSVTVPLGVAWCWDGKDASGAPTTVTEWIVKVGDVVVFRGALTPTGPPSASGLSYYETPKSLLIAKGQTSVTAYGVNDAGKGAEASYPFVVVDSPPGPVVGLRVIKS